MKTLYIISKGVNELSDEEIRQLEKQNRHPRVLLLQELLSADLLDENYLYNKTPKIRRWIYTFLPVIFAQIFETLIIQRKYDLIFTYSEKVGLPMALLMKYLGLKVPHLTVICRITSMDEKKSKQKQWLLKKAHSQISRILIWSSVQRSIVTEKLGIPGSKVKLLKIGTDQKFWRPLPVKADMICSVGMEMRDYPTLIEALRPLDIPCHIAAGAARGEIFDTVKRLYDIEELPKNITVGPKSYEELQKLYARSRFTVVSLLPTDSDNGLTTILESMAMGKPVICSRVEGQVDVIEEGVTGLFVPQGNPVALRKAITELWNDPERAERMGRAARKYIEEVHNLEQFVSRVKEEAILAVNKNSYVNKQKASGLEVGA